MAFNDLAAGDLSTGFGTNDLGALVSDFRDTGTTMVLDFDPTGRVSEVVNDATPVATDVQIGMTGNDLDTMSLG